jgi:DNA-binding MarR family transcriptional regulator
LFLPSTSFDHNIRPQYNQKYQEIMKLFAALRQIRHFERSQLPFLKSILDFDLVIEIGYAEEIGQPLTQKQVLLLNLSSRTTVRRRLASLVARGVVKRRKNVRDQRSSLLTISSSHIKLLGKYGGILSATFAAITS